jgi:hypothetical protein
MQELFEDYSEILAEDSPRSEKIIQRVVSKKLKALIEGGKKRESKALIMSELDSDTLYNLLEEAERRSNEEE